MPKYAEVIVASKSREVDRVFNYEIPAAIEDGIQAGMRVLVPFGKGNAEYEGYITGFADSVSISGDKIKCIIKILDDIPVLDIRMLKLAAWMREKYFTPMAECIRLMAPAAVKCRDSGREYKCGNSTPPVLTAEQSRVFSFVFNKIKTGNLKPTLIQGVTGSGKTEIYLRLIQEVLNEGRQAIMLVPEISLTPQMIDIFTNRFGSLVGVTHSRLSAGNRYSQWNKARLGKISVMVGTRSAVFTPFKNLGLVIIDEEHDHSYKSDLSPKYAAKEIAGFFSREAGVHMVSGSATPSVESYYEAESGAVDLVTLKERVNKAMPQMHIVDMRAELLSGNTSVFSGELNKAIEENLSRNEQSILFLNRRGHSTFVSCRRCGFVLKCDECSVNFTYHIYNDKLMCHYCGKTVQNPENCPACGSRFIRYFGVGTQRIEEELTERFPHCRSVRMDFDTTSRKNSHERILKSFKNHEADVLIGTQMITKGLDIEDVTLVGVICADISLNMGDFRCGETTFQLLTQVAGRAGRASRHGRVIIQTYNPEHYSVVYAGDMDYPAFYSHEISLRRQMQYPPFTKIFQVMFSGEDEKKIIVLLYRLKEIMNYCNKQGLFDMIGPAPAIVSKVKKNYRWQMTVKCTEEVRLKNFVLYCVDKLKTYEDITGVNLILTPNPI